MNIKKRFIAVVFSILLCSGVCTTLFAAKKVSPWKVSKAAIWSLLGLGCGLSAVVQTVKKSTGIGMKPNEKIDNLNIAFLTIVSCYSFVWAYEHYQNIVKQR